MNVHFSHNKDDWETPRHIFDYFNRIYKFDLDVCANADNAKCKRYFDDSENGLKQIWYGDCWMNPPYSNCAEWIKKAYEESRSDILCRVVCLIPARTDTRYWHEYVTHGSVFFIKGRLKFSNSKNSAPFPSCVVIFDKRVINKMENLTI